MKTKTPIIQNQTLAKCLPNEPVECGCSRLRPCDEQVNDDDSQFVFVEGVVASLLLLVHLPQVANLTTFIISNNVAVAHYFCSLGGSDV